MKILGDKKHPEVKALPPQDERVVGACTKNRNVLFSSIGRGEAI
jgi:hypothetical protein